MKFIKSRRSKKFKRLERRKRSSQKIKLKTFSMNRRNGLKLILISERNRRKSQTSDFSTLKYLLFLNYP